MPSVRLLSLQILWSKISTAKLQALLRCGTDPMSHKDAKGFLVEPDSVGILMTVPFFRETGVPCGLAFGFA